MRFFRRAGLLVAPVSLLLIWLACGDTYRPVANPIIGPGGQPQLSFNAWVANTNPTGNGSATQINVSGETSSQVTNAGAGSSYEAFLPPFDEALFVANKASDNVTEMDLVAGNPPTTVGLLTGSHPVALASSAAGFIYVANSGPNSDCPNTGSMSIINTANLVVTNTICVGVNPVAIAQVPGAGQVFVVNQGDNTVSVYSPSTQAVTTITTANGLGLNPVFAVPSSDGIYVFLITQGDGVHPGTLDLVSVYNDAIFASVPLGVAPTFGILDGNLNRLYVTNKGSDSVMVFDASNVNANVTPAIPLLGTTTVGTAPVSLATLPNGTKFYTANSGSNDVSVVSATSFSVLKTVPVGQTPMFVASEPSSTEIFVANYNSFSTSIIQTVNDTVAINIPAPQQDPTCVPSSSVSCPLQQPFMVVTH